MTKIKRFIKKCFVSIFKLFNKEYLIEYWIILKNEPTLLSHINQFYQDFIKPGMKIIDVGGNTGNYSKVFLNLGAKVIAVEPQKYCQQILQARFRNQQNMKIIPAALGAKETIALIHKSNSHTIASMNTHWINNVKNSRRFPNEEWSKTEETVVTTLDNIIKENFVPDYIKIDVEGFEPEVLKGLSHRINYVSFEITLPEMTQSAMDCIEELERIGNYSYSVPSQKKLSRITEWKTKKEIVQQLEELKNSGTGISADLFAKAIK